MADKLEITWKKSSIGYNKKVNAILRGLGLRRLNHTVIRSNTPEIRGMVRKILHLVKVREIAD